MGDWGRFILKNMSGLPLVHGKNLHFYCSGMVARHSPNAISDSSSGLYIGLVKLLQDRFVSIEVSFDRGTLTDKPIKFKGTDFHVNCNAMFGKVEVQLKDAVGNPLSGCRAIVKGFDKPLRLHASKPVQVKCSLYNAQLYSFRIESLSAIIKRIHDTD